MKIFKISQNAFLPILCFLAISVALYSCKDDEEPCEETTWYQDSDGDGYGNSAMTLMDCTQPTGYVADGTDFDDTDADLNPTSIWSGASMTFTKAANADFNLAENQDRISDSVWITRGNSQGIFNIKSETDYEDNVSPAGTQWAFGTTAQLADGSLVFNSWESTITENGYLPTYSLVDKDLVLYLVDDKQYIDIKFVSWGQGGGMGGGSGGAFSYTRSTQ